MSREDPLPRRIDRTIRRLGALGHLAALPHALAVGRIVTEELADGDPAAHRERAWTAAALRRLASDPRLPISESSLYRGIGVYELARRHDPLHPDLCLGHLRAVLGLPVETQDRLLATAIREGLHAHDLEVVVRAHRRRGQKRRRSSPSLRTLRRLAEALEEVDPSRIRRRAEVHALVCRIRDRSSALARDLEAGS